MNVAITWSEYCSNMSDAANASPWPESPKNTNLYSGKIVANRLKFSNLCLMDTGHTLYKLQDSSFLHCNFFVANQTLHRTAHDGGTW